MEREIEVTAKRKCMGTYPDMAPREDEVYFDLRHLKVELVDYPTNPYKAIFRIVVSTWGSRKKWWSKWEDTSPEGRLEVVKAALEGKTLPACLEAPSFTFAIQGVSRASFDQMARTRYSAIGSMGSRDDAHLDAALVLPPKLKRYESEIRAWWVATKDLYEKIVRDGKESWQTARFILPMGMEWRWSWTMNYRALRDMLLQRMCFAEQHDTVALAWKMWTVLWEKFPLLASYIVPRCDKAGKCLYSQIYSLAEYFGNLFKPCGRNPAPENPYAIFNEASTSREEILGITWGVKIPEPQDWPKLQEEAAKIDWKYFL